MIIAKKNESGEFVFDIEKAQAMLDESQKLARTRKLEVKHLSYIANKINSHFDFIGVCKKNRKGCTVVYNYYAQKFANCYKGVPESTFVKIGFNAKGYPTIEKIYRAICGAKVGEIKLTDDAKTDVILHAEKSKNKKNKAVLN